MVNDANGVVSTVFEGGGAKCVYVHPLTARIKDWW